MDTKKVFSVMREHYHDFYYNIFPEVDNKYEKWFEEIKFLFDRGGTFEVKGVDISFGITISISPDKVLITKVYEVYPGDDEEIIKAYEGFEPMHLAKALMEAGINAEWEMVKI